jgi:16S rRNA (cytosine967-C5)-methyltransferase
MASAKTGARGLALAAIKRVEKDKAYLDRLVDHYQNNSQLNEPDRRLLTELAYGAVRHQRLLDFYIEQILDRKIHQTDLTTRNLLRLGAYQLLFLNKIPARAAVNETVELSANYARPLVNAVLRKLAEKKAELKNPEQIPDRIERLAVKYSHPDWMVKRFIALFGETEAEELLAADNQRPELNLRVNTLAANRGQLLEL